MKNENKYFGPFLITISLLITYILWVLSKPNSSIILKAPVISLNQLTALFAVILFSWSLILSTRLRALERFFGGLDKIYSVHKAVSIWGGVFIFLHPVFLSLNRISVIERSIKVFFPVHSEIYMNIGIFSFWIFLFLIFLTLFIKIPYHVWKFTHKFMGGAFVIGFVHMLIAPSDVSYYFPLKIWMVVVAGMGLVSYLYYEFLYKAFSKSYLYKVKNIQLEKNVYKISFHPQKDKMIYKPGQFAYISFINNRLGSDMHPFSITSHPDEKGLDFAVKVLGDFTARFSALKKGDIARIYGPYGDFGQGILNTEKDIVFIAGGIGIAPFISMLKYLVKEKSAGRSIDIYYCTRYKEEACFEKEIIQLIDRKDNFHYHNQCSIKDGHLTSSQVLNNLKDVKNTLFFLCGPKRLTQSFIKSIRKAGGIRENIFTEEFAYF